VNRPEQTIKEFARPFRTLPLCLRHYWWRCNGKQPASDYLMWMIESIDPEVAEYLALRDVARRATLHG
jgi:hypothetical protein